MMLAKSNVPKLLSRRIQTVAKAKTQLRNFSVQSCSSSANSLLARNRKNVISAVQTLNRDIFADKRYLSSSISYTEDVEADDFVLEKSRKEAWMVNLGRGDNDKWLNGPRNNEWFTGVSPKDNCPGKQCD